MTFLLASAGSHCIYIRPWLIHRKFSLLSYIYSGVPKLCRVFLLLLPCSLYGSMIDELVGQSASQPQYRPNWKVRGASPTSDLWLLANKQMLILPKTCLSWRFAKTICILIHQYAHIHTSGLISVPGLGTMSAFSFKFCICIEVHKILIFRCLIFVQEKLALTRIRTHDLPTTVHALYCLDYQVFCRITKFNSIGLCNSKCQEYTFIVRIWACFVYPPMKCLPSS